MQKVITVYLASLTYDPHRTNVDDMPLAIGCLAAYLEKHFPGQLDIRLFRYPDALEQALEDHKPDIVGFSNYVWMESISKAWASEIKAMDPNILVIMGGPNFPIDESRQLDFLQSCPAIDIYIRNEAEPATRILIEEYIKADGDIETLKRAPMPNAVFLSPDSSELIRHPLSPRMTDLDEVPSPYLSGHMDQFFDGNLIPTIQTNRGCPFSCAFCNSGASYLNKIRRYSPERIEAELNYLTKRVLEKSPGMGVLRLVDDNFAMYPEDMETVEVLSALQKDFGYPKKLLANTGKNKHERIIKALRKLNGALTVSAAVQTMTQASLKAVSRLNINIDAYFKLIDEIRSQGLEGHADTILGLPEETKQSYQESIRKLLDAGLHSINNTTLYLMMGSNLEMDAERAKHGFRTHWRAAPGAYITVKGKPVIEVEEIVTSTNTMPFEDWLDCRNLQLWLVLYCTGAHFDVLQFLLRACNVDFLDFVLGMKAAISEGPVQLREVILGYEEESLEELSPTQEAVIEAYTTPEACQRLSGGERGHALLNKYAALATMNHFAEMVGFAHQRARDQLEAAKAGASALAQLDTVMAYIRAKHVMADGISNMRKDVSVVLDHDVEAWRSEGFSRPLDDFKLSSPKNFKMWHDDESWDYLIKEREENGTSPLGLVKIRRHITDPHLKRYTELDRRKMMSVTQDN